MKIVVDSNRIIASLLKDSTTRKILYNETFNFVAPKFIKEEILKHKKELVDKSNLTEDDFDSLLALFFGKIELITFTEYNKYLNELKKDISDLKDISYLACSYATKSKGIWSHDPHFKRQKKVKVLTNIDMLELLR